MIDRNKVIVTGHTRLKAAKKLGIKTVPCIMADDLTDEQIKAFRLADNKVAEFSEWDEEKLMKELEALGDIDMSLYGFEFPDENDEEEDDTYTSKTNIPQYDVQGEQPDLSELVDTSKTQELLEEIENSDLSEDRRTIVYARNACFDLAKQVGVRYFLELDDDYTSFMYRFPDNGKLGYVGARNLDALFEAMIDFLDASRAVTVAFAQGGDFIGGINSGNFQKGLLRKAMNTFFCDVEKPFKIIGRLNEDTNTYVYYGTQGKLLFTVTNANITQLQTQSNGGGMTDVYLDSGTFLKSFFSVIFSPQAVTISTMGAKHMRLHHKVNWSACTPMILNEKWKK